MWPEREHGAFEKEVDDGLKRLYFGRLLMPPFWIRGSHAKELEK